MTTLDHLLRAVLIDPADDGARLVYADALEECGDGAGDLLRAKFIRVQVELAKAGVAPYGAGLRRRERWLFSVLAGRLIKDLGPAWPFPGHSCQVRLAWHGESGYGCRLLVRRGFVESAALPLAAFGRHAEALFRAQPVVRVTVPGREPDPSRDGWCWYDADSPHKTTGGDRPHHLPRPLFAALQGGLPVGSLGTLLGYASRDEAHAALSRAAVALGRRGAGLPPLAEEANPRAGRKEE